jgi:hypothetical protein
MKLLKLVRRSQWHETQFLVKECSKTPDIQWRLKSTVGDNALLGTKQEQHNAFKDSHYRASNLPKPPNTNHANYIKASGQPANSISVCWITDEHECWQCTHNDSQETSLLRSEPKSAQTMPCPTWTISAHHKWFMKSVITFLHNFLILLIKSEQCISS